MIKIVGVGCDLVEIDRIKTALTDNPLFLDKILTENEKQYCLRYKSPESHIAARFAAKEAVSKALGVGIGKDIGFKDIEVSLDSRGKPYISLSERGKENFPHIKFEISLSHTATTACAFVVAFT
jgi:holo-[acyl-carrier protein] synthase